MSILWFDAKGIVKSYTTRPFIISSHKIHESSLNQYSKTTKKMLGCHTYWQTCIHELNICPVRIHARTGNYENSPNVCWCFMWKQRHSFWKNRAYVPAFLISLVIRKGSRWFLSYHPILVKIHENIILDCIFEK